jgi:hypothetical protein
VSQRYPETVALIAKLQAQYEQEMRARGKPIPRYDDQKDGLPTDFVQAPLADAEAQSSPSTPREGKLKLTSKAEIAREIMRQTKDSGKHLDEIVQMIMDATGHDKALAKATYKANAARVGITL